MLTYKDLIGETGPSADSIWGFHQEHLDLMRQMPASIKQHHNYKGGYHDHILEVMRNAYNLYLPMRAELDFALSDLMTAAYIHDLDKLLYRYEVDKEEATEKQYSYARSLGVQLDSYETKRTISAKIDAKKNGVELDSSRINIFSSRQDGMHQEDSGIVMHLAYENGIRGINPTIVHAVGFHHGGFNPYATVNNQITLKPIAKMLHCADLLSTIQNGN